MSALVGATTPRRILVPIVRQVPSPQHRVQRSAVEEVRSLGECRVHASIGVVPLRDARGLALVGAPSRGRCRVQYMSLCYRCRMVSSFIPWRALLPWRVSSSNSPSGIITPAACPRVCLGACPPPWRVSGPAFRLAQSPCVMPNGLPRRSPPALDGVGFSSSVGIIAPAYCQVVFVSGLSSPWRVSGPAYRRVLSPQRRAQ